MVCNRKEVAKIKITYTTRENIDDSIKQAIMPTCCNWSTVCSNTLSEQNPPPFCKSHKFQHFDRKTRINNKKFMLLKQTYSNIKYHKKTETNR